MILTLVEWNSCLYSDTGKSIIFNNYYIGKHFILKFIEALIIKKLSVSILALKSWIRFKMLYSCTLKVLLNFLTFNEKTIILLKNNQTGKDVIFLLYIFLLI